MIRFKRFFLQPSARRFQRKGFVLFTVLGILTILATLMVAISVNTQTVSRETAFLVNQAPFSGLSRSAFELAAAKILARDGDLPLSGSFSAITATGSIDGSFENLGGKVDLNTAPVDLLVALLKVAGLNESDSLIMAVRIVDWRDDNLQRESDGEPEASDYSGARNSMPKNAPFQSILELAQIPGMTDQLLAGLSTRATVFSAKTALHVSLADIELLENVPGLQAQTIAALRELRQGTGSGRTLDDIIAASPILQALVDSQESQSWGITASISADSGGSRSIEGAIAIVNNDTVPYRILAVEGPLEKVD